MKIVFNIKFKGKHQTSAK